jgi:phytoene dehydrogenase-like protein
VSGRSIVIGAGANELVAAHLLARAGHDVLLLDPGESGAGGAADCGWVAPQLLQELGLEPQRVQVHRPDPWITVPVARGERLELWNDATRSAESIRRLSASDAARWPEFCERTARLARALEAIAMATAPDPLGEGFDAIVESLGAALRVRRVVGQGLEDLLRLLPMPVADFLDDWFECDALKGALGAAGILHLRQGPRSGGTTLNFLQHHAGCAPGVFRPPLSNFSSVLARLPGIEIRHEVQVARITVRDGRVAGVVLANGEEVAASVVFSGADPQRTLLEFVEPVWLEPEFARTLRGIRSRGAVALVRLELDRDPGFSALAIAPSLDYLERAYDDAKYGRVSREPYVEARVENRAVRVHVQYVPKDAAARDTLGDLVVRMLDAHVPGFGGAVTGRTVLLPSDLEKQFGWPEGQLHHAEPALDQWLWMRPTPELARYRTPIDGLHLCGPAMHPGGWLPGACGYHAARQVLKDH